MIKELVKEYINGQMEMVMKEIFQKIKEQEMEYLKLIMVIFIKDNLKMVKEMVKEYIYGKVVINMKEIL